ncbi:ACT domain-containing protein [Mobilicoccus massiliensis]|uniref:ACT domain-containing protein n=1 Tax=Mobilicoccus massiliensis TaxID=1522310 RepID=UPI001FE76710|nr:ACT domain-containing protein [Mobilicoccus massiliensis]
MTHDQIPTAVAREGWTLRLHPGELVFARLEPGSDLPEWARDARPLSSIAWNESETSVLAPVDVVPGDVDRFGPWRAFEVEEHVDFLLTGVLHGIISPLAASHLAVTTVSTYRTDWILVPAEQVDQAVNVWRYHGYQVTVPQVATEMGTA